MTGTINIVVEDVNDNPPVCMSYYLHESIAEDTAVNTEVGI